MELGADQGFGAAIAGAGEERAGGEVAVGVADPDQAARYVVIIFVRRPRAGDGAALRGPVDGGALLLGQPAHRIVGEVGDVAARVGLAQHLAERVVGAADRDGRGGEAAAVIAQLPVGLARLDLEAALVEHGDRGDRVGDAGAARRGDGGGGGGGGVAGKVRAGRRQGERQVARLVVEHDLDRAVARARPPDAAAFVIIDHLLIDGGVVGPGGAALAGDLAIGVVAEPGRVAEHEGRAVPGRRRLGDEPPGEVVAIAVRLGDAGGAVGLDARVALLHHPARGVVVEVAGEADRVGGRGEPAAGAVG